LIASANNAIQIADAFCHEGSHARLALYLMLDPLLNNDPSSLYPSPWRKDERPLSGILNGVHAFVNVCEFYRRLAKHDNESSNYAKHMFLEQRSKILVASDLLFSVAKPTPMGRLFLTDLQAAVSRL
jgi:HEXXH motif-containing protein